MPLILTVLSVRAAENSLAEVIASIAFSGSYPSGGDTIDFTTLYGQPGFEGAELDSDQIPLEAWIDSVAGGWGASGGGYYVVETYTPGTPPVALAVNACKLRAFAAGGTETSGSYATSQITRDRAILHAFFKRTQ